MAPLAPQFATAFSLLSAWSRSQRIDVKDPVLRCGLRSLLDIDFSLGGKAKWLADTVLDGWLTPAQVIDHHTHVPLFASLLTVPGNFAWRERLLTGRRGRDGTAEGIRRLTTVESQTMRRCPTCVAEDRRTYGCAHWRLFHQWPVARHCVVHGDALETCCARCRMPFTRAGEPRLADDPCRHCASARGAAPAWDPPPGYWPLLRAMYGLLRGGSDGIAAAASFVPLWGQTPLSISWVRRTELTARVVQRALDDWHVETLPQLADELGEDWIWFNQYERSAHISRWPPLVSLALRVAQRSDNGPKLAPVSTGTPSTHGRASRELLFQM